jgi:hypothetical protein
MTYNIYTKTGPFTNGSAPGINKAFLDALETFCAAGWFDSAITSNQSGILTLAGLVVGSSLIKLPGTITTLNGSTSGTMRTVECFIGPDSSTSNYLRLTLLRYSNYRNAAASNNDITLTAPFTTFAWIVGGAIQGTQFLSGGSAITLKAITTLGGTSDGTGTSTTTLHQYSIAEAGAFTVIREPGSNGSAITGNMAIIGM